MYKTRNRERETECGERKEWAELHILGNVIKHSEECCETFHGMPSYIPGNVAKHSEECCQTCGEMLPYIPGNVPEYSGEIPRDKMMTLKYLLEILSHLELKV